MIEKKIKTLRERAGITQAEFAQKLNMTRAGVNAWEIGISKPSVPKIKEIALLFGVSTDYILCMPENNTVSVDGLSDREIASIIEIIDCYKNRHSVNE